MGTVSQTNHAIAVWLQGRKQREEADDITKKDGQPRDSPG